MMLREAFLQDILADPEDDTVRLIYADWLSEQGDPRGEFIHVQIRLTESLPAIQAQSLRQREQELLREHAPEWLGCKLSLLRRWVFRRGFVDEIELRADAFLKGCGDLLAREPVRQVRLRWVMGVLPELTVSPSLSRLRELNLSYNFLNDPSIELLAGSPHLGQLRTLSLAHNVLRQRGAEALASTQRLGALKRLDLSGNLFTAAARQMLATRFGGALRL